MAQWYAPALGAALNKEIDFVADDVRATLHTSTYVPDRVAHDYVDDLGATELATAGGYTAGGVQLASKTAAVTAANSWADTWPASTAVEVDYVVRPTTGNGFLYRCVVAGTTAATEPTWPTVIGTDVTDNTATWECVGRAILVLDCGTISWATATFTGARYLVISDRQTTVDATSPLIGLIDFGGDEAGGGGSFDVVPDPQGLLHHFIA